MTDLEINIALAKAMGWAELSLMDWLQSTKTGYVVLNGDQDEVVKCVYHGGGRVYKFDYRDPVIFVAICKHWELDVHHSYQWVSGDKVCINAGFGTIEKAAALCVIEMAKRGVK